MRHFFANTVIYALLGFGVVFLAIDCQWKNTAYRSPAWIVSGQKVKHVESGENGVIVGAEGRDVAVKFGDDVRTVPTGILAPIRD